jgi:hypothetical protein
MDVSSSTLKEKEVKKMKPINEMSLDELREEVAQWRKDARFYETPVADQTKSVNVENPTGSQLSFTQAVFRSIGRFGSHKARRF